MPESPSIPLDQLKILSPQREKIWKWKCYQPQLPSVLVSSDYRGGSEHCMVLPVEGTPGVSVCASRGVTSLPIPNIKHCRKVKIIFLYW